MSQAPHNPPAFPSVSSCDSNGNPSSISEGVYIETAGGMTLRDYFAAAVMPEEMRAATVEMKERNYFPENWRVHVAMDAYATADAMLKARELTAPK